MRIASQPDQCIGQSLHCAEVSPLPQFSKNLIGQSGFWRGGLPPQVCDEASHAVSSLSSSRLSAALITASTKLSRLTSRLLMAAILDAIRCLLKFYLAVLVAQ